METKQFVDSLRKKINNFLNGGDAQDKVDGIFREEMDQALEEVRPEIADICKTSVRAAIIDLKTDGILFDKKKLASMLNDELENAMDHWEEEIKEAMADVLVAEIKTSRILPKE